MLLSHNYRNCDEIENKFCWKISIIFLGQTAARHSPPVIVVALAAAAAVAFHRSFTVALVTILPEPVGSLHNSPLALLTLQIVGMFCLVI